MNNLTSNLKLSALVVAFAVLSACGSAQDNRIDGPSAHVLNEFHGIAAPGQNEGLLIIVPEADTAAASSNVPVTLDGSAIGDLAPGQYLAKYVPVGDYQVSSAHQDTFLVDVRANPGSVVTIAVGENRGSLHFYSTDRSHALTLTKGRLPLVVGQRQ